MNNLLFLARFGHGGSAIFGVLFIALLAILAIAIFADKRDAGTNKK